MEPFSRQTVLCLLTFTLIHLNTIYAWVYLFIQFYGSFFFVTSHRCKMSSLKRIPVKGKNDRPHSTFRTKEENQEWFPQVASLLEDGDWWHRKNISIQHFIFNFEIKNKRWVWGHYGPRLFILQSIRGNNGILHTQQISSIAFSVTLCTSGLPTTTKSCPLQRKEQS